jgi:phage-related minor tail protein
MPDRTIAVRLTAIGGDRVRAEMRDVGTTGERALQRIEQAARPASRALQAVEAVAGEVRGGVEAMASRLGPAGAALAALGPVGLAAAAALGVLTLGISKGLEEAGEAEQSYRRLEAVLKATGYSAGLTADHLVAFADGQEEATLTTAEAVQDAATVLATFRSVAGDTFTRALSMAGDMAAVFGGDLSSSAMQLGKALEDPVEGLSALRRVGVSFTGSQSDLIRSLVETGQVAEAQRVILDALEQQVGGAAAAEAGGVTGAANRLSDAWGKLLEEIGKTPAVAGPAEAGLNLLARATAGWANILQGTPIDQRIAALNRRLVEAQDRAEDIQRIVDGASGRIGQRQLAYAREDVTRLQAELDALIDEARQQADAADADQRQADAADADQRQADEGRARAEAERRGEIIADWRRKLDEGLTQLANDPAERIARVNAELDRTRQALEALRSPDGGNADAVDAALAKAEELARRRIAQINQPERDRAARDQDTETKRRQAALDAIDAQIAGLSREREALSLSARERAIQTELLRTEETARKGGVALTDARRDAIRQEAGATFDATAAAEARNRLLEEGARLTESLLDPTERYQAELTRLGGLLDAGAISWETYSRALEQAAQTDPGMEKRNRLLGQGAALTERLLSPTEEYAATIANLNELEAAGAISAETRGRAEEQAADRVLAASRRWQDGAIRGLKDYAAEAGNAAAQVERVITGAFGRLEDALVDLVMRQKLNVADLLNAIAEDFARMMIRMSITAPLAQAASNALAGIFHDGGTAGGAAPGRQVPLTTFLAAPRLHTGTVPWLAPDEIPAILQRGEIVLNRAQSAAMTARGTRSDAGPAGPVYVIQVDATGATDPEAVAARVEAAVDQALAVRLPGVVRAAAGVARAQVADDWSRRGGRFG